MNRPLPMPDRPRFSDRSNDGPPRRSTGPRSNEGAPGRFRDPRGDDSRGGPRSGGFRPDGPRNEGSTSGGPRRDGPYSGGPRSGGPRHEGPYSSGPRRDGPRQDGPYSGGPRAGGPRNEGSTSGGPRRDGPRNEGPYAGRRDGGRFDGERFDGPGDDRRGGRTGGRSGAAGYGDAGYGNAGSGNAGYGGGYGNEGRGRFRPDGPNSGAGDRRGPGRPERGDGPGGPPRRGAAGRPQGQGGDRFSPRPEGRPERSELPERGERRGPGNDKRFPARYTGDSPRRPGTDARAPRPAPQIDEPMRLNRFLARAGVAARRKADLLIASGAVTVNGAVVTEMGVQVQPGDAVAIHGKAVTHTEHVYLLLNKPDNVITTKDDERGRDTVLDLVDLPEAVKGALFPVGRLDRHTTGVLLLTTDGELAHRLLHPSYGVDKYYRVRTLHAVKPHEIDALKAGVELEDGPAKPDQVGYVALPDYHEVGMRLHEGRNRMVRRMMEAIGHEVVELERVRYADLTVDGVRRGKWRRLAEVEVKRLRRLVKLT